MYKPNNGYYKKNMQLDISDIKYYDVRKQPFSVCGLYKPETEKSFTRMPIDVAEAVSAPVLALCTNPSGGRVRFRTDSEYITVKAHFTDATHRSIMSLLCSCGFDIYIKRDGKEVYYSSFRPPIDIGDGYESAVYFPSKEFRDVTIYMPLYSDLDSLMIGVNSSAQLISSDGYRYSKPIVYYGSSITQGASVSRPGMTYEAMISRRLDCDFINLGFAGAAKAEQAMCDYLASLDCSMLVCDYDYNAPTPEYLDSTHYNLYKTIRNASPTRPIVLISRPVTSQTNDDSIKRRAVVMNTYQRALEAGDKNVYFVDGFSLFGTYMAEDCMADGIHPNDLGSFRMAEAIGKVIENILIKNVSAQQVETYRLLYN